MKAIGVGVRLVVILLLVLVPSRAHAQSAANSGQITGQVVDSSQAAMPDVTVMVRNVDTNYERSAVTDGAGRYAVTQLPLGRYEVVANAAGFEKATQHVFLTLASNVSADFDLSVGPLNEQTLVV